MEKTNLIKLINEENNKKLKELESDSKEKDKFNETEQISELRMHKILYFIYGYFYKEFKKALFEAKFEAWTYGPVETDYRYLRNISKYDIKLSKKEFSFLEKLISKLLNYSIFSLVEESHLTRPWKENFDKFDKRDQKIPNEEIQNFYKK